MGNLSLNPAAKADTDWWTRDRDPFVKPARIAEQVRVHSRTVERCLQRLEEKGLVKRPAPCTIDSGRVAWPMCLTPHAGSRVQIAQILPRSARTGAS